MSGLGLKLALLLHPAAYRREWGEELAAVFADTTAGTGRWTTAREAVDLAGHGLRLRIGLGSDGLPAQLAALAAPFAATAAVAWGLVSQPGPMSVLMLLGPRHWRQFGMLDLWPSATGLQLASYWLDQAGLLLLLLAAVAAVCGRWTMARSSGVVGLLATLSGDVMELTDSMSWAEGHWAQLIARAFAWFGPQVLWALIPLAAPRDLLGPAARRRSWSALAGALTGGVLLDTALGMGPVRWLGYGAGAVVALVLGATELALLAVAVPALLRGRYGPAAAALAGSPVVVLMLFIAGCFLWKTAGPDAAVALLGVATLLTAGLSRWRPTIPDRRPPTAG
ncbi:hypothetical protein ABH930_002989 [Kitasatospora sp. GAS204A]|uniref:hypothetical protein n=1 Tax=unclassified Kitasatospora TaxID=2633591 RepID=UPI0024772A81|nr:hypothetical protein [Kitasatospora sp. GAS204B]MDH6117650.1 hypothetical protein [Kitasatospora sp. GAS204B]